MSGDLFNKGFRRTTSIPRKLNIVPENVTSPQKAVDVVRGKEDARRGALFSKGLTAVGGQTRNILDTERKKDKKGRSILK